MQSLSAFSAGIDRLAEFLEKIQVGTSICIYTQICPCLPLVWRTLLCPSFSVQACVALFHPTHLHPPTLHTSKAANRGRLGPSAKGPGQEDDHIDLKTTLSKPFIERIRAMQQLAAGEPGNVTALAGLGIMGAGAGGGMGVGGLPVGTLARSDSPAPLLGRESSVDSVTGR